MKDSLSILIVDDIPENIQVAANLLKDEGYDIAFALDGATAIEHLKSHAYDLVLLDIMMPGMDGFEVCRQIKENEDTRDVPVIFLTAKHDIESVKKGFKLGAVDYVSKPFNAEELLVRVNNHLKLIKQQRELKRLNYNQKRFLSVISHDIKEPFSNVLGFSELLQKQLAGLDDPKAEKYLNLIHLSARNGYNLLNNLLEWSRSQLDAIEFVPKELDLKEIVGEVEDQQSFNIQRKAIQVEKQLGATSIVGDKNMITTILRNLIANAVKYSHENGKIIIKAEAREQGKYIAVQDFGVGMAEEDKSKLFRIEEHVSTPGTHKESGAGLGLILVREFAERHSGSVDVKSAPGEGSSFIIFFPEKKSSEAGQ